MLPDSEIWYTVNDIKNILNKSEYDHLLKYLRNVVQYITYTYHYLFFSQSPCEHKDC